MTRCMERCRGGACTEQCAYKPHHKGRHLCALGTYLESVHRILRATEASDPQRLDR